jgi:peptidoglycan/LPS O-acetylase OafA/YrhL
MMYPPFTFLYLADAAVSIFFVLSGYVLTRRFYVTGSVEDLQSAATRRYVRLVGPAFVSVMFAWMLQEFSAYSNHLAGQLGTAGWVIALYTEPVGFIGAVFRGLVGAPLFARADLNGPLWTLQIELVGSVLLFAIYSLFGSRSKFLLIVWFMFFAFLVSGRSTNILHYGGLLAGSLLHIVEAKLKSSRPLSLLCLILGLLGVSFTFASFYDPINAFRLPNLTPYGPDLGSAPTAFWHTLGSIFLVAGVVGVPVAQRFLQHRLFVYLGRVSFSIYLLHFPLIMSLGYRTAAWGQSMGLSYIGYAGLAFLVTMVVLFVLSEIFCRFVDIPSIRLAAYLAGGKVARGPAHKPAGLVSNPAAAE